MTAEYNCPPRVRMQVRKPQLQPVNIAAADALMAIFGYTRQAAQMGGESKTTETRVQTRGKAVKGQGRIITGAKEYTGDKPTKETT
jgi:hypothetical protein